MKELFLTGNELTEDEAKNELLKGHILTTKDGAERAMCYKGQFAGWFETGNVRNILMFLTDFTGWYLMACKETGEYATKKDIRISDLHKAYFGD